ncbi:MAG TPA: mechanosensitive ion channel family protein [Candidatus Latescibacteria bacterium]|nr:mechanosensitive ion channel family protein [Candidatus Latescibacterota bacterium]
MTAKIASIWEMHYQWILDFGYKVLLTVAVLAASYLAAKAIRRSITRANERFERLDATLVPVLTALATYAVYALGTIIVLDILGVNTASIITVLGATALAIGLALKDTLGNLAAGIMLLILRPFRAGDLIKCGTIEGTVEEARLFTTKLQTIDGLFVEAPNSELWNNHITNFTRNGKRRMDIVVGISYSDSIDKGLEVLAQLVREEPRFLNEPPPQAMVKALSDSCVEIQLRAWTSIDDYWNTYFDQNRRVKLAIEAAGLTIPFPQRDVHVVSGNMPGPSQ